MWDFLPIESLTNMCDQTVPFHDYNCPECAPQSAGLDEDIFSQVPEPTDDPNTDQLHGCGVKGCPICNPRVESQNHPFQAGSEGPRDRTDAEVIDELANENSSLRTELDKQDEELAKLTDLANALADQSVAIEESVKDAVEQRRSYQERLSFAVHVLRAIAVNGVPHTESNRELALIALATVAPGEFQENLENLSEGLR